MEKFKAWARWEFDRRIEVTPAIRFITIERFVKGAVLIIGGIILIVVSAKSNLHHVAQDLQTQLNLSPGRSWWVRLYDNTVVKFGNMSRIKEEAVGVGAILYGLLEAGEGFGLLLRRRWAEYLVLIATCIFLPVEIDELAKHPTLFKAGALLVNLAIIAYLVWRKRLFLERPGHATADMRDPEDVLLEEQA